MRFDAPEIVSVEVDGPSEVQKRVTVTRVLALGLIALAVPKKEKLAYLVIASTDGEAIIEVHSMSAMQLRAAVQPFGERLTSTDTQRGALTPRSGATDRLVELGELREKGLVTEQEYEALRTKILEEL